MPALSFQEMWLDDLLSGRKKQTTRATDRIKVGHVCNIYNQQRKRINGKELRRMTHKGIDVMYERGYPWIPEFHEAIYHAHFLGKVEITEVYDIYPREMSKEYLRAWAKADGFEDSANLGFTPLELADTWFRSRYGDDWMDRTWYVIRWDEWLERYFEPKKRCEQAIGGVWAIDGKSKS